MFRLPVPVTVRMNGLVGVATEPSSTYRSVLKLGRPTKAIAVGFVESSFGVAGETESPPHAVKRTMHGAARAMSGVARYRGCMFDSTLDGESKRHLHVTRIDARAILTNRFASLRPCGIREAGAQLMP